MIIIKGNPKTELSLSTQNTFTCLYSTALKKALMERGSHCTLYSQSNTASAVNWPWPPSWLEDLKWGTHYAIYNQSSTDIADNWPWPPKLTGGPQNEVPSVLLHSRSQTDIAINWPWPPCWLADLPQASRTRPSPDLAASLWSPRCFSSRSCWSSPISTCHEVKWDKHCGQCMRSLSSTSFLVDLFF